MKKCFRLGALVCTALIVLMSCSHDPEDPSQKEPENPYDTGDQIQLNYDETLNKYMYEVHISSTIQDLDEFIHGDKIKASWDFLSKDDISNLSTYIIYNDYGNELTLSDTALICQNAEKDKIVKKDFTINIQQTVPNSFFLNECKWYITADLGPEESASNHRDYVTLRNLGTLTFDTTNRDKKVNVTYKDCQNAEARTIVYYPSKLIAYEQPQNKADKGFFDGWVTSESDINNPEAECITVCPEEDIILYGHWLTEGTYKEKDFINKEDLESTSEVYFIFTLKGMTKFDLRGAFASPYFTDENEAKSDKTYTLSGHDMLKYLESINNSFLMIDTESDSMEIKYSFDEKYKSQITFQKYTE